MAANATRNKVMEMSTITPSRLKLAIKHSISHQRPLFIWGQPGIGKSELVAEVARWEAVVKKGNIQLDE